MTHLALSISALLFLVLNGCGSSKSLETNNDVVEISALNSDHELTQAIQLDKKVVFTAKFQRVRNGVTTPGLSDYSKTHYLISVTDMQGAAVSLQVFVPANNTVLASLRQGEMIKIEGVPHTTDDNTPYIIATNLTPL